MELSHGPAPAVLRLSPACVGHCFGRRRWLSGSALMGDTAFVLKKALFLDLVLSVWELVPDV